MDSQSIANRNTLLEKIKGRSQGIWSNLNDRQQFFFKKIWQILTYKWQWQIILNAPFLLIWILDQSIPAVHTFDMHIISLIPIPSSLKTIVGLS